MGLHVNDVVQSFLERRGWKVIDEFASLLRMGNVTGSMEDLRGNDEEIVTRFARGGASMDVVEMPGAAPLIVGELLCDRPTARLGVYVHCDGQPVSPDQWTTADPASMVDRVVSHLKRAGYVVLDRDPTPDEPRAHRRLARLDRASGYRAARMPMDSAFARTLLDVCERAAGREVVALRPSVARSPSICSRTSSIPR